MLQRKHNHDDPYFMDNERFFLPVEALHGLAQIESISNHYEVQPGSPQVVLSDIQPLDRAAEAGKVKYCSDLLFGEKCSNIITSFKIIN